MEVDLVIDKTDDGYLISLGDSFNFKFLSKREAEDCKRLLEKKIRSALYFINGRYSDIYSVYRSYFFYIDDFKVRHSLENSFKNIEDNLNYCLMWCHNDNRNHWFLKRVEDSFETLMSVYEQIRVIAISRRDVTIRYEIESKCHVLASFIEEFKRMDGDIEIKTKFMVTRNYKLWKIA